jgi:hypothetical protein
MEMFSKEFINSAGERAVKTFAQAGLAFLGGGTVGLFSVDWIGFFSIALGSALLSVLTSIITKKSL